MSQFQIRMAGILLGIAGFLLIGATTSWWAAAGVLIVMWGHNIEKLSD